MKTNFFLKISGFVAISTLLCFNLLHSQNCFNKNIFETPQLNIKSSDSSFQKYYLSTTIFILTSVVPKDNYYFYNFEFGLHFNKKSAMVTGATIYQYTTPEFVTWTDAPKYNGFILAYGPVIGYHQFFWKGLFLTSIVNPLKMDYKRLNKTNINSGFMLLLAARGGFRLNFKIFKQHFYVEPGIEVNYKAVNTNVPSDFKQIDDLYSKLVFMPAFNVGIKF